MLRSRSRLQRRMGLTLDLFQRICPPSARKHGAFSGHFTSHDLMTLARHGVATGLCGMHYRTHLPDVTVTKRSRMKPCEHGRIGGTNVSRSVRSLRQFDCRNAAAHEFHANATQTLSRCSMRPKLALRFASPGAHCSACAMWRLKRSAVSTGRALFPLSEIQRLIQTPLEKVA